MDSGSPVNPDQYKLLYDLEPDESCEVLASFAIYTHSSKSKGPKEKEPPKTKKWISCVTEDVQPLKECFDKALADEFYNNKSVMKEWTKERIDEAIKVIEEHENGIEHKSMHKRMYLNKFEILKEDNAKILIRKRKSHTWPLIQMVLTSDEYYDVLKKAHKEVGHGKLTAMLSEILSYECYIPTPVVEVFYNLCKICCDKKNTPSVSYKDRDNNSDVNASESCCSIEIIDMRKTPDGNFKWILLYQDRKTKFIFLRPLISHYEGDIAKELLKIILEFGCPDILESYQDWYFNIFDVTEELEILWPDCKIQSRKCHNIAFNTVNFHLCDQIMELLSIWMSRNKTNKWSLGIKFIQYQRNIIDHVGKSSPFKYVFGKSPNVQWFNYSRPPSLQDNLKEQVTTEEDFKNIYDNSEEEAEEDTPKKQKATKRKVTQTYKNDDEMKYSPLKRVHKQVVIQKHNEHDYSIKTDKKMDSKGNNECYMPVNKTVEQKQKKYTDIETYKQLTRKVTQKYHEIDEAIDSKTNNELYMLINRKITDKHIIMKDFEMGDETNTALNKRISENNKKDYETDNKTETVVKIKEEETDIKSKETDEDHHTDNETEVKIDEEEEIDIKSKETDEDHHTDNETEVKIDEEEETDLKSKETDEDHHTDNETEVKIEEKEETDVESKETDDDHYTDNETEVKIEEEEETDIKSKETDDRTYFSIVKTKETETYRKPYEKDKTYYAPVKRKEAVTNQNDHKTGTPITQLIENIAQEHINNPGINRSQEGYTIGLSNNEPTMKPIVSNTYGQRSENNNSNSDILTDIINKMDTNLQQYVIMTSDEENGSDDDVYNSWKGAEKEVEVIVEGEGDNPQHVRIKM